MKKQAEKFQQRDDEYWALCNGCGIHMNDEQIAYTNDDGDDYCADCWEAIQGDEESLRGTPHTQNVSDFTINYTQKQ